MRPPREISDQDWARIAPLFPELAARKKARGRPVASTRAVFNAMLWVLYTKSAWREMPRKYPPYTTCHRRFKAWYDSGVLREVVNALPYPLRSDLEALIGTRTGWRRSREGAERFNGFPGTGCPRNSLPSCGEEGVASTVQPGGQSEVHRIAEDSKLPV